MGLQSKSVQISCIYRSVDGIAITFQHLRGRGSGLRSTVEISDSGPIFRTDIESSHLLTHRPILPLVLRRSNEAQSPIHKKRSIDTARQ